MAKTLQRYGNSLALVIDKPIRRMLGIGTKTLLELRTDGRRLIVEPLPDELRRDRDPDEERLKLDAHAVAERLVRRFAMWIPHSQRLLPGVRNPLVYLSYANGWAAGATEPTADDYQTMRRLETCLLALQDGKSWDDAIEAALQRAPVTCRDSPNS